jgi:protein ImuB
MFACIFIPDFNVEAVLRAEPMLRGQAVAVFDGKPPLCYVVGVNEAARRLGVEIGMTKLLAETLRAAEEPKIGRTEEQPKNRRSDDPKNGKKDFTENPEPRTGNSGEERGTKNEERTRRPHAQGAYETTYGRMNQRFGLYRARLDADELYEHSEPIEHSENQSSSKKDKQRIMNEELFSGNGKRRTENDRRLILRQRSAAQEASAHAGLLDAAHAVSPRVEDSAQDAVVLDVDGLERLFGTPQQVAQELVGRVIEVGLVANVAIAANPDAAEHAARGYTGVTIIPAGQEARRLATLPLEILFSAERNAAIRSSRRRDEQRKAAERFIQMQETLDRWGIRNFRGLAALPPVSLSERLGTNGVRLQMLASGVATRELVQSEPALRFEETIELEYPVDVLEPLAFQFARMLDGLCGRLAARALATNELRLRLRLEHRTADETAKSEGELERETVVERKLALPVPMNDARLFLKLLQLELSATPPGAPVTQLWLEAEPARPRMGQTGLFQPLAPEAQKLELTLARLHKLLGVRERIRAGCAEILDTHQPDRFAVKRFQPESGQQNGEALQRQSRAAGPSTSRPNGFSGRDDVLGNDGQGAKFEEHSFFSLRRFRPPLPAEVELREDAPVRITCVALGVRDPRHDNVVWASGPWRNSGNWWEKATEEPKTASPEEQLNNRRSGEPNNNEERITKNEEPIWNSELGFENWNSEEWDIALALTLRGSSRRERATEIGFYRLVRDCGTGNWRVEGSYD